ncbi:MAG: hypothetical protein BroJett030_22540 [Alphaproteobacteria bacterium]|nr:MAG: hypothetical protein BroJett030_22540 [Alphaproteobacteria bacterium]
MTDLSKALDAAVDADIVSPGQRDRLARHFAEAGLMPAGAGVAEAGLLDDLSAPRDAEPAQPVEESEAPRFVRGFHDILITIGVVAALAGLWRLAGVWVVLPAILVLAEILVRRQRLALPAFTLTVAFALAVFSLVLRLTEPVEWTGREALLGVVISIAQPLALIPFYWRYRVPAALAAIILAAFGFLFFLLLAAIQAASGTPAIFTAQPLLVNLVALACALALFATAMAFDLRDPGRLTRRSDVAFWLHLGAAPALLYGIVATLLQGQGGGPWWANEPGLAEALVVVGVITAMMLTGIVIDRRAFVTSGLVSLGAAILVLARVADFQAGDVAAVAVLLVGLIVLVLGVGWLRLRRLLLAVLPPVLRDRLPPAAA